MEQTFLKVYELEPQEGKPPLRHRVELKSFEIKDLKPDRRRVFWWNSALSVGIGAAGDRDGASPVVSLGISTSSYGYTRAIDDTLLTFNRLAVGVMGNEGNIYLEWSPIQINVGPVLPLVRNLDLYPFAGYDLQREEVIIGGGLGIKF